MNEAASGKGRRQLARFVVVGSVNTLFSYLVYSLFLFLGLPYQLANFLSLVVGILFSFKTQGRFVFGNRSNRLFGRFVASWLLVYVGSISLIGVMVRHGIDAYLAGFLALPFTTALSFVVQKYVVFSGRPGKTGANGHGVSTDALPPS